MSHDEDDVYFARIAPLEAKIKELEKRLDTASNPEAEKIEEQIEKIQEKIEEVKTIEEQNKDDEHDYREMEDTKNDATHGNADAGTAREGEGEGEGVQTEMESEQEEQPVILAVGAPTEPAGEAVPPPSRRVRKWGFRP